MKIEHVHGVELEHLMTKLFACKKSQMGGLIGADALEDKPLDAAILSIGKLYCGDHDEEIDKFLDTWKTVFKYPDENAQYTMEQYIDELEKLINLLSA